MKRWKTALAIIACVVLGVAVVLSARDGGVQTSADEQFVDSLCAAAIEPRREMIELIEGVAHTRASPGREYGWNPLYILALRARFVALEYRVRVRAIRAPDTPAGAKASRYLDHVSESPLRQVREMISWVRALPRDMSLLQSVRSLSLMEQRLLFPIGDMSGEALLVTVVPELADEFQTADSCTKLDAELARQSRD